MCGLRGDPRKQARVRSVARAMSRTLLFSGVVPEVSSRVGHHGDPNFAPVELYLVGVERGLAGPPQRHPRPDVIDGGMLRAGDGVAFQRTVHQVSGVSDMPLPVWVPSQQGRTVRGCAGSPPSDKRRRAPRRAPGCRHNQDRPRSRQVYASPFRRLPQPPKFISRPRAPPRCPPLSLYSGGHRDDTQPVRTLSGAGREAARRFIPPTVARLAGRSVGR